jgi:hypothetical protein
MSIDARPVIEEINLRGGRLSAQFLSSLLVEVFRPERYQREPESLTPLPGMADLADELDHRRANAPGGQPFNLIPSPPAAGACCPLCVGVAINGFRTASSVRRPNFNQLSLRLAEHWLRSRGSHAETLSLTPDWNQRVFEDRCAGLHVAPASVFIAECARIGLILRFPS